ncbi:DUF221-domain-containing protein [Conidiobolus coronatus NRRL 28638]|uniref:DUF221-domain-containing protein n=1 Tax=Conidiobolus coronatus (strain ATCC 28846 / CBS 209.66 / NRRL 28638) TaxID=796925 RepID=A0A137P857_CONC2|nr:DUF221-domain-containing protein [Conidiobolus coronatus NRRL 28638]|eukprot:KXN71193.1 DUF221-domain-containing protein [Conidiobolus coronatus NRRL 28638]
MNNSSSGTDQQQSTDSPKSFWESIAQMFESANDQGKGGYPSQAENRSSASIQLAISVGLGVFSILLFSLLRKRFPQVFQPRSKLETNPPPKLGQGFFGWIVPIYKISQAQVLRHVGLDAVIFLRFFLLCFKIFAVCAVYGLLVLVPLSAFGAEKPLKDKDAFYSIGNFNNDSSYIIAHVVGVYIVSLVTYVLLAREYQVYSTLRWEFLLSAKKTLAAKTIMIKGLPKELRDPKLLMRRFEEIKLEKVSRVSILKQSDKLHRLIRLRAYELQRLESCIARWIGNPCTLDSYDPNQLISLVNHYEAEDNINSSTNINSLNPPGYPKNRPQVRTGFLGLFGPKADGINYHLTRFQNYDLAVKQERAKNESTTCNIAFVTFESIRSTHIAAQLVPSSVPLTCRTSLAPEPKDIHWPNIAITGKEQSVRSVISIGITALVIVFFGIPLALLSSLFNISTFTKVLPFLQKLRDNSPVLYSLLQSFLPTLSTIILVSFSPYLFIGLSMFQGYKTYSLIESAAISKHFAFLLINVFLIFTFSNTVLQSFLESIIKNPSQIPDILAESLPKAAPFFLNYVMLLGIGFFPFQLIQIGPALFYFIRQFFVKTPREYAGLLVPLYTEYSWLLGQPMLVFVICLTYSIQFPLILVVAVAYFLLGYYCNKYCLLYINFPYYESGGLLWPKIFRRITTGLFLLQILMLGFFTSISRPSLAGAMVPLIIFSFIYRFYLPKLFPKDCKFLPVDVLQSRTDVEPLLDSENQELISRDDRPYLTDSDFPSSSNFLMPIAYPPSKSKNPSRSDSFHALDAPTLEPPNLFRLMDYLAVPSYFTDYHQSTMSRFYGVLDSGIRGYTHPVFKADLPTIWVPLKARKADLVIAIKNRSYTYRYTADTDESRTSTATDRDPNTTLSDSPKLLPSSASNQPLDP